MRIETSKGKTYPIRAMSEMIRDKNQVLIELDAALPFAQVAAEFDGLKHIKRFREEKSASYEMFEGFSRLVSMRITDGGMRVILEKP